jgi:glycosyltransferase involved in cell wall biosynthesis
MCAGIDYARGEVIVTMDGDLQNDPADIPILLERIHGGADLVAGWRRQRQDHFLYRTFPSMVANWVVAQVSDVPIHDTGCSLKAYRSELIKRIPLYSELHRFIPAMSVLASRRIEEVEVRHYPRLRGRSKYGLSRIGKVLLDLMVVRMLLTTGWRPLHWFATGGVISLFAAGLVAIAEVWHWASAVQPDSYVLPVVAIMLVYLGIHLLFAGVLAELVVAQNTPPPAPLSRKIELPAP